MAKQNFILPSPIQELHSPLLEQKSVRLFIKRDDLIHPVISGNKWRKLKFNLIEAKRQQLPFLTFGGAYSNHIHAVAGAGKLFDIRTIGIIRGEENLPLNPTLQFAKNQGMKLHYISRKDYRQKNNPELYNQFKKLFGPYYLVPEGGSNSLALPGVAEIITELDQQLNYDSVVTACGTGGTIAGLLSSKSKKHFLGIAVLKGADFLRKDVKALYSPSKQQSWDINLDYHFGGYAKYNKTLLEFITEFEETFQIKIEPIYTAKMFYGLFDLIEKNTFKKNSTIIALHTGGLQGIKKNR
ncbi:pyridoxal phosphate-dependent deaminase, putative [hydrothermal vent metagenome]|uniref:Pyridoxal phosphate-dependent deaminase, putative n=1 Tax=hydrothermal vent metagenome TaxID=652676 RepID=A0A3B0YX10_9ZZZZ